MSKIHIVWIMTFSPKFAYEKDNDSLKRADHIWKNNKNQEIGVWLLDWAYKLGFKFINKNKNYIWEVWRPDIRADKIYTHTFDNGMICKSFPVRKKTIRSGIRINKYVYSPLMVNEIKKIKDQTNKNKLLVVLPSSRNPFSITFLKEFKSSISMHFHHFLYSKTLIESFSFDLNLVKSFHKYLKIIQRNNHLKKINSLTLVHKEHIKQINKKYKINTSFNTFGIDLDFWKDDLCKIESRKKLNINVNKHIFLFSSRIVPEYQIDKVLDVIYNLKNYDIHCFFTSQGNEKYLDKLRKKIKELNIGNLISFTGFVSKERLKVLYSASDTFFMTSIYNAGPLSTIIAMRMKKNIISTNAGLAFEILKEKKCGIIVPAKDYTKWEVAMKKCINNNIKKIDPILLEDIFDWQKILMKWDKIFKNAIKR